MKTCDICERTESEIEDRFSKKTKRIELDSDGLRICEDCARKMTKCPLQLEGEEDLDEALTPLIGKSAGAICRTLELPYTPPYQAIIDAAVLIAYDQDRYMSAWSFFSQWLDGTTVWRSEDHTTFAFVSPKGDVHVGQA